MDREAFKYYSVYAVTDDGKFSVEAENIHIMKDVYKDVRNLGVDADTCAMVEALVDMDYLGLEYTDSVLDFVIENDYSLDGDNNVEETLKSLCGMDFDELTEYCDKKWDECGEVEEKTGVFNLPTFDFPEATKYVERIIRDYFKDTKNHDFDYGFDYERKLYREGEFGIGKLVISSTAD